MKKNYKLFLTIAFLVIYQSLLYLISKLTPIKTTILTSTIDSLIPFIPYFIYFYIFWYVMLFIVPYLLYKSDEEFFKRYFVSTFISITVAGLIYTFFPTSIVRASINGSGITNFIVKFIYLIDTPVMNCFPSMHCIISFLFIFSVIGCRNLSNKYKWVISILSCLIVISTLLVKQHVVVDVISGFIISSFVYFIVCKTKIWTFLKLKDL